MQILSCLTLTTHNRHTHTCHNMFETMEIEYLAPLIHSKTGHSLLNKNYNLKQIKIYITK